MEAVEGRVADPVLCEPQPKKRAGTFVPARAIVLLLIVTSSRGEPQGGSMRHNVDTGIPSRCDNPRPHRCPRPLWVMARRLLEGQSLRAQVAPRREPGRKRALVCYRPGRAPGKPQAGGTRPRVPGAPPRVSPPRSSGESRLGRPKRPRVEQRLTKAIFSYEGSTNCPHAEFSLFESFSGFLFE
jgi:hypothetical protein